MWLGALGVAAAQDVVFDLDDAQAQQMGIDTAALEEDMGNAIGEQLNLADPATYLGNFANAAAMSTKGMGVDYASNPKKFSAGGALGSAVSGVPISFARGPQALPEGGYAFMMALHAGVNLGLLTPGDKGPLEHVLVYVSGLGFRPPSSREFRATMYNFGAHGQVKLFGPVDLKAAEWGGLDLTAGYEQSFYELELAKGLPITQDVDPATVTWDATGNYTISATGGTVPLEVSTNLRVFVATGWLGFAYDLDTATASSQASLSGPLTASAEGVPDQELGTATVSVAGEGAADPQAMRLFAGLQANVMILKVFGQVNVGLNQTYGGFVGVRLAM